MKALVMTFGAAALVLAGDAAATEYRAGNIKVSDPWTRATPQGAQVAGGFMRIENSGKEPDRLIGGSMPLAGQFQVHEMTMVGDVMRMREVTGGLDIKAGARVELKPGSYHVMFMQLKEPIRQGGPIRGTLVFEKAGNVDIQYHVQPIGWQPPASKSGP